MMAKRYRWARRIIGLLVSFQVFAVMVPPFATPPASDLSRQVNGAIEPYISATFLNHGYRFFAPNPGPSHVVRYEIFDSTERPAGGGGSDVETSDGFRSEANPPPQPSDDSPPGAEIAAGYFPQRGEYWPRLLYHRWFMLSETINSYLDMLPPDPGELEQQIAEYEAQIQEIREAGDLAAARELEQQMQLELAELADIQRQFDSLLNAVAQNLMRRHGGDRIALYLRERRIPLPADVRQGVALSDPRYFNEDTEIPLGRFRRDPE